MRPNETLDIVIRGARTNNLKDISLRIPHNKFIVVTGVSGSGKSSLAFELIAKEGQRRYFETLPSFARQFLGKLNRPDVDQIDGLSPVIAIGQRTYGTHARSTMATMSDTYDLLRLLYARTGITKRNVKLTRSLFSFNAASGKCPRCNGIGNEEKISLDQLIKHPEKTIREGALAPTLPNGYIMYSQVTIDALNQVCEAEGFSVDIPWNALNEAQRDVILHGSEKIKVPFGKHSLESRLKWTGIKAKPREEGYYKGMIPIMSDILRRDRNANILKYVHAVSCADCQGARLNQDALSVLVKGKSIAQLSHFEISELKAWFLANKWETIAQQIVSKLLDLLTLLEDLGLGHLRVNRPANSLRGNEIQRICIANQLQVSLSNVLYVFDEPSIGLHASENRRLLFHLKSLVQKGNTVLVVEHDLETIAHADHIIEIGSGAGTLGGELVFNGSAAAFKKQDKRTAISATYRALYNEQLPAKNSLNEPTKAIRLLGCYERNLKHINVEFKLGKLNVISGKSGTGKSSLVWTLRKLIEAHLANEKTPSIKLAEHQHIEAINKLIYISHAPIGQTPRSNPATYLGIANHIRDIYASTPESKANGFTKSRFSFNNKGGRCETCQGAGKTQIGMHFLGNIDLLCESCKGARFNEETLAIKYKGRSIADCYRMSVNEAVTFFKEEKKVMQGLRVLQEIGLGYLKLGQSATTLSGGEAQRIKIANQLQKKDTGDSLYVIVEPSIGLHYSDMKSVMSLFDRIKKNGNTIVCIEQDELVIGCSDWHIELGPEGGARGGELVYQGIPKRGPLAPKAETEKSSARGKGYSEIALYGVKTNGLKAIDVRIPKNQITVVTGLSGSGKSSLVYDTLFAESNARFTESLATYQRSFLKQSSKAQLHSDSGLSAAIGINRSAARNSKQSTVATKSGAYDALRLLYSRIAQHNGLQHTAQHFSFNHHLGACPKCEGGGSIRKCDSEEIISDASKNIFNGAFANNKSLAYYADLNGQFMATLKHAAQANNWNLDKPWNDLTSDLKAVILYGTGDIIWELNWHYKTKTRAGIQELKAPWLGLCNYIDDEYKRKVGNKNLAHLLELMHEVPCDLCHGSRLKAELMQSTFLGKNIHELCALPVGKCFDLIKHAADELDAFSASLAQVVLPEVCQTLQTMEKLGLGHLALNRTMHSLSGGEGQRVSLAGQLATQLYGVTYVLDEPSIGLDDAQIETLLGVLKQIVANGNTVVVVEHDATFIRGADYIIEMGPGAGTQGGEVVYQGRLTDLASTSLTAKMMKAKQASVTGRQRVGGQRFGVHGARANNLKGIDVEFYAGQITAVTGISGSGKSSLVNDVLYRSWQKGRAVNCAAIFGLQQFDEVLKISQEPIANSRLSTPVSHTKILDQLKACFAKTESAQKAGLKRADFSYFSKGGKCATCSGYGKLKTSMDFMNDILLLCHSCKGMRYNKAILKGTYNKRSIGEVLQLTVDEAVLFIQDNKLRSPFELLQRLGVGHLKLGQAGDTLSGGEVQRLKLATAMLQKKKGVRLYLFDEPSTGLHYFDIQQLAAAFHRIVENGDSIIFVEHNQSLIAHADRVLTLGPGCGISGGQLVS